MKFLFFAFVVCFTVVYVATWKFYWSAPAAGSLVLALYLGDGNRPSDPVFVASIVLYCTLIAASTVSVAAWYSVRNGVYFLVPVPVLALSSRYAPCWILSLFLCLFWEIWGVLQYAYFASRATTGDWFLRLAESPCGKSSCVSDPVETTYPYNPNGWYSDVSFVYALKCPAIDCDWADFSDEPPLGYPADEFGFPDTSQPPCEADPCDWLPTDRPSDYPDLGSGLTTGLPGGSTKNVALCPNVTGAGLGKPVCAECTSYFRNVLGRTSEVPGDCPERNTVACYVCPGAWTNEKFDGETLRGTAETWFVVALLNGFVLIVHFYVLLCVSQKKRRRKHIFTK